MLEVLLEDEILAIVIPLVCFSVSPKSKREGHASVIPGILSATFVLAGVAWVVVKSIADEGRD